MPTPVIDGAYVTVTFTSTSACEWTVPAGVTSIDVLALGGGGGGGRGVNSDGTYMSGGGGGGGGGGERRTLSAQTVSPGSSYSVIAGAGGAAGVAGGSSSLGSLIVAVGGGAGGGTNFYDGGSGGTGGTGGSATRGRDGGKGRQHLVDGARAGGDSTSSIFAGTAYCAGAGGGGGTSTDNNNFGGAGGLCGTTRVGGTGAGKSRANGVIQATAGTDTSGSGGGGGGYSVGSTTSPAKGGSGVVVIGYIPAETPAEGAASCPTGFTLVVGTSSVCEVRFTSTGASSWTVPSGVTAIDIIAVGGGGGGGYGPAEWNEYNGGAGGGGGGHAATAGYSVTAGWVFTVQVGAGGAGATSARNAGLNGGESSFARSSGLSVKGTGGSGGASGRYNPSSGGGGGVGSCTSCATSRVGTGTNGGAGGDGFQGVTAGGAGRTGLSLTSSNVAGFGLFRSGSSVVTFSGGGGGGSVSGAGGAATHGGGAGAGGAGPASPSSGVANTGGGGGGGRSYAAGASGGSGLVALRTAAIVPSLAISVQPSAGAINATAFTTQPVVRITTSGSATAGLVVTAAIASAPAGSSALLGTLTATSDANGDATFSNLAIRGPVGTYTLSFSATEAASVTTSTITLSVGEVSAGNSVISASTAALAIANPASTAVITVQGKDSGGNNVTTGGATVVLNASAGTLSAVTDNGNGTYTAVFTAPGVTGTAAISGSVDSIAIGTGASIAVTTGMPLTPSFSAPVATLDGFTLSITNYDPDVAWTFAAPAGVTVSAASATASTLPVTVTGLAEGASATVTVTTSRAQYSEGSATVTGQALAAARTPTFDSPIRTADGFTVNVTNYDASFTWTSTSSEGTVTAGSASGAMLPLAVVGLSAGAAATVTISTARDGYLMGSGLITGLAKEAQRMTWAPTNTSLFMPGGTITPSIGASSSGEGTVSYVVLDEGGTGCSMNSANSPATWPFTLTYSAPGTCIIRASAAGTHTYGPSSTDVNFVVALATQSITARASSTSLSPGQSAEVSASGMNGTGVVTWAMTSGAGVCTLIGTTVLAVADGTCVMQVTIDADSTYATASSTVIIRVVTPGVGGAPPVSSGGSAESTASENASSQSGVAAVPTESQDRVPVPGTGAPTRGRALPPAPAAVEVVPSVGRSRSTVLIKQPVGAAGSQALATVVVVRDAKGKVVSRLNVALKGGQGEVQVTVPFIAKGYSVNVYNVNEVGVSIGALTASPLVRATTITARGTEGRPTLFGTMLGSPIIFAGASSALSAKAKKQLKSIARTANASNERIFITGFARKGGGTANELASLSTKRAHSAAKYLATRGVRVWIRYWGAGSLNGTGRTDDRRVEVRTSALPIPRSLVP